MSQSKEIIIIGGGVSGLGMAVQLRRNLGHDNFMLYEKSDNIGGTWWHNRYPACACDIPSHLYSYSFAMKHDWSTMFPGRDELHGCTPLLLFFLNKAKSTYEKYRFILRGPKIRHLITLPIQCHVRQSGLGRCPLSMGVYFPGHYFRGSLQTRSSCHCQRSRYSRPAVHP